MRECPRCGYSLSTDAKFCPECGAPAPPAPLKRPNMQKHSSKPLKKRKRQLEQRLLIGLLGILAMALSAIVLLMVEDYQETVASASHSAEATFFQTPSPSPSPTPTPSPEEKFYGAWIASRIETNKNKNKPNIDVRLDTPFVIFMQADGFVVTSVLNDDELVEMQRTEYSFEGDSIYLHQGMAEIEGVSYQARVRYFFNKDEMRCVYLLNGREVSDYIVFSLYSEQQPQGMYENGDDVNP